MLLTQCLAQRSARSLPRRASADGAWRERPSPLPRARFKKLTGAHQLLILNRMMDCCSCHCVGSRNALKLARGQRRVGRWPATAQSGVGAVPLQVVAGAGRS